MLIDNLINLCQRHDKYKTVFSKYLKNKDIDDNIRDTIFVSLYDFLLDPSCVQDIAVCFPQYLHLLLCKFMVNSDSLMNYDQADKLHRLYCVILSKILDVNEDVKSFVVQYFNHNPAPFESLTDVEVSKPKRRKLDTNRKIVTLINDYDVVLATYKILKAMPKFFKNKWNWSQFYTYLINENDKTRWLTLKCIQIVFNMSEFLFFRYASALIKSPEQFYTIDDIEYPRIKFQTSKPSSENEEKDLENIIAKHKFPIVNVAGVPLLVKNQNLKSELNLVSVPSLQANLRNLAIGVCSEKCVCLQGPVGCGKTAVVEHLAKLTGHEYGKDFIKVQLGDQTDSKMLLGMYICTDIPGEFIWQPGVLTKAVMTGKWLLLEDIDCAPLDVASVLSSLLESGTLSVPGYRDSITVKNGFQLFVTQRLVSSASGLRKKSPSGTLNLLEKYWLCVNMEPLSRQELITVVQTIFPNLNTVASKMVDVFLQCTGEGENTLIKSGRLTSTRDLVKWCLRSNDNFDVSSPATATKIFQNAIDIFCSSIPNQEERLKLSTSIGHILGQTTSTAEYFGKNYKPTVIDTDSTHFTIGRTSLQRKSNFHSSFDRKKSKFSFTRPSACLLERVATCVLQKEPVLLVGETGTGKTSSVQYLAQKLGHKLIVLNMNQQSESADLLGGYKPIDLKFYITPIREEYEILFRNYFPVEPNKKFLSHIAKCSNEGKWKTLVKLMAYSSGKAVEGLEEKIKGHNSKTDASIKKYDLEWCRKWRNLTIKLDKLKTQVKVESSLAFTFIEGSLVKALKEGYWILLDEINLATAETLECLSGLLDGASGSLSLLERGDKEMIKRHPDFTIFACMNPATDIGKKELPVGLRNRFTEFFVDELTERSDLQSLVATYLEELNLSATKLESIVKLYLSIRKESMTTLCDGVGHKPHFSLRTLCRALNVAVCNPCGGILRSLYEGFCLSFLTQLDEKSYPIVKSLILKAILKDTKTSKAVLGTPILRPTSKTNDYINFEGYWIVQGDLEPSPPKNYILTPIVRRNLKDLARIVSIGKMPILLQGDTSVGKTSLIMYLAKSSGHTCLRINNHEHTDLQEYVGSYVADETGKLVFKEGILVEAMRKGHWIILDELNLAPSDVLEALNRVLDDNHELFIPETQTVVKAHANFMLFATQNPPGLYGGRKVLSRAFRNRFVELHFDEIPADELQVILHERCSMPDSYCKQIINVMRDLQVKRKSTDAFAGKQGFITLRDLFRWGERYRLASDVGEGKLYDWSQHLADEGYLVLTAKVRKNEEIEEIRQAIKKHLRRDVDPNNLFNLHEKTSEVTKPILQKILETKDKLKGFEHIVWTYQMRRMAVLVMKSYQFKEPVLLVGETGGGKTTVCQLASVLNNQTMHSINCHMHTESSDFLGNLRPVRNRQTEDTSKLFEWVNGPLIEAMINGGLFLADEISLADDSVLERLNSLLEPERSLLLTERGNESTKDVIVAHETFFFIGTMNPGGDFGKKELSPALRNRFTEIWCESCTEREDLQAIAEHNLQLDLDVKEVVAKNILDFVEWLVMTDLGKKFVVSIRDILSWVHFINVCTKEDEEDGCKLRIQDAYLHGAYLTYIDGLGSGLTSAESAKKLDHLKESALKMLNEQITKMETDELVSKENKIPEKARDMTNYFGIDLFYIKKGSEKCEANENSFTFEAKTTRMNMLKVVRALQLEKPLLLEGSPGVGKTSLVSAIAKSSGHKLLRINLSDQTDMSDLFGADLPVENGKAGEFAWRDGPFLRALQAGDWILLDELNLASQSVLEGLNACFDHRGEIYVPELNKTFQVKPGTKFFACQNPLKQGGGRRGLPKSFLNRFAQVFVDILTDEDLRFIIGSQFPELDGQLVEKMIIFNSKLANEAGIVWGHSGSPWEMNLRDLTRWCEVMVKEAKDQETKMYNPGQFVDLIYADRMRTVVDKDMVKTIYEEIFGEEYKLFAVRPQIYATREEFVIGDTVLKRSSHSVCSDDISSDNLLLLRDQMPILRNLARCVEMNWMAIIVGASGSGKTSVVHTLSHLAGQPLKSITVNSSMDTTEILGSFEQTDYNRHLEQLFEKTQSLLLDGLRVNFKVENLTHLKRFHKRLEDIRKTFDENEENGTMSAATKHFLHKTEKLLNLINAMQSFKLLNVSELNEAEMKLKVLISLVERDGCLNAGGKFEWVDSLVVKCLRDGCWLLIDQVNLCNPAMLDRLNGLLEPNGVLSIGERGVDSTGNVVTIKPHPNFRLFLTMDPKYGEISRAMRNRGLEIYILAEKENRTLNSLDQRSMLYNVGLIDRKQQNVLLKIHEAILQHPLTMETLNISQLMHIAFLIVQHIARGFPVKEAFLTACSDVYLKARFVTDNVIKQTFINIFEETLQSYEIESNQHVWDIDVLRYENVTHRLGDLTNNAKICIMKQKGFILRWVIDVFKHLKIEKTDYLNDLFDITAAYYGRHMMELDVEEILPYLVLQFYEYSTLNVINAQKQWLENVIGDEKVNDLLRTVKKHNQMLAQEIQKFNFGKVKKSHVPWDHDFMHFNNDQRITDCNRLALLLHFCIKNFNEKCTDNGNNLNAMKKVASLMEYSHAVCEDKILSKTTDYPLIDQFYSLIQSLKNFFYFVLNECTVKIKNEDYALLRTNLLYLTKFESLGDLKLNKSLSNNSFDNIEEVSLLLKVYYKWLLKFMRNFIKSYVNDEMNINCKVKVNETLTIINKINTNLTSINDPLRKVSKFIKKATFNITPHSEETNMKIHSMLQEIISALRPWTTEAEELQLKQTLIHFLNKPDELKDVMTNLINVWTEFYLENEVSSVQCLEQIQQTIDRICPKTIINTEHSLDSREKAKIILETQLWPFYEYLFTTFGIAAQKDDISTLNLNFIDDFTIGCIISPETLALLNIICRKDSTDLKNRKSCLKSLLFYSLERTVDNMNITQTSILLPNIDKSEEKTKILTTSTTAFSLLNFVIRSLISENTSDLTSWNLATTTLGSCNAQTKNLEKLNELLWKNCAALNSPMFSHKLNDLQILHYHASSFLSITAKANTLIKEETDNEILERIQNEYLSPLESLKSLTENLKEPNLTKQGKVWCLLGYLEVFLFANIGFIDPVHKVSLKLQNLEEDISDIKHSIYVSLLHAKLSGLTRNEHPRAVELEKHLETLLSNRNSLQKFKAVRPDNKEFLSLCRTVSDFISLLANYNVVSNYVNNLEEVALQIEHNLAKDNVCQAIEEAIGWQNSCQIFIEKLERFYLAGYPDIVLPILTGLLQMKHGFDLLIEEVHRKLSIYTSKIDSLDIESFVYNSLCFPTVGKRQTTLLSLVELCTDYSSRQLLNKNVNSKDSLTSMQEQFRITLSALKEFHNHVILQEHLSKNHWNTLNSLLHQVILIWTQQQNRIKEKEAEKASLYKNKATIHSETETDEEMIQREIKYLFPTSRDEDFGDIESKENAVLGDTQQINAEVSEETSVFITETHMQEIYKIHSSIVTQFTSSLWLKKNPQGSPDYIEPLIQRYNSCKTLLNNSTLTSETSLKLLPSLNVLTHLTFRINQDQISNKKTYDFYRDSNVEEVTKCFSILDQILRKINELLEQWPEHPTLQSIVVIINRIFDFAVTSPISRFLTGLELLLVKMQEWEEIAHKGISLLDYSTILTQQIISWRQYELACWKDCLNTAQERLSSRVSKWWFYLYSLFDKYTLGNVEESKESTKKVIDSLQQFMNESPLAEFESRLELLFTFHCHLCYSEPNEKQKELISVLWNLYNYYHLLLPQVKDRINELKNPIQTGLKNFVKIARWNDISYWAVKETIHKTHKTLHSFIKKFEIGLKENVASCFVVKPSFEIREEAKSARTAINIDEFLVTNITEKSNDVSVEINNEAVEYLKNIESKTKIARKVCKEILSQAEYSNVIEDLQIFIEEFMELSAQLKNSEIDRTLAKTAQKSLAKSIFTQKKSSLSRYFKDLKDYGVSDRKGILKLRNKEEEVICLTIGPIAPESSLSLLPTKTPDKYIIAQWNGCDKYYYKSIHLLNTLNTSSYVPQKGLSAQDVEKFKGFSADLMMMANKQRKSFINNWEYFITVRRQINDLRNIDTSNIHLFDTVKSNVKELKKLLVAARTVLDQLELYMQSCPETNEETRHNHVLMKSNNLIANCRKGDNIWNKVSTMIKESLSLVKSLTKQMESKLYGFQIKEDAPDSWMKENLLTKDHLSCLSKCFDDVKKLQKMILSMTEVFSDDNEKNHPVIDSLDYLIEMTNRYINECKLIEENGFTENSAEEDKVCLFENKLEELIKHSLLAIQKKLKKDLSTEDEKKSVLSQQLVQSILKDVQHLKIHEFCVKLTDILSCLKEMSANSAKHCIQLLHNCTQLFDQYILLSQFYLTEELMSLRLTCKMLYLQLNVFLELTTNGFCVPKDLEVDDDGEEESSSNTDKGGMGLADGEGEKDVSERIENEDQLDDAKLPNQEKDEKPDNNCKEEDKGINMSEDFDGELQDIEKPENEEGDNSDDEDSDGDDLDKQMDELGKDADKLDEQIWGKDEEEVDEEPRENDEDIDKGEQMGDKQMDAKTDEKKGNEQDKQADDENAENQQQPEKEINEMKEPEINEDHIDPYHGQQREEPEVEPMDLPDDLNLDDEETGDKENEENENPFDIDEMKESAIPPEKQNAEGQEETEDNNTNEDNDFSDDEDGEDQNKRSENNLMEHEDEQTKDDTEDGKMEDQEKKKDEGEQMNEDQQNEHENKDKALPSIDNPSTEVDAAEQIDTETSGSKDSVAQKPEAENKEAPTESSAQENNSDKGVGQSHTENQSNGHSGSSFQEQIDMMTRQGNELQKNEKRKNPGQADDDRTLVNDNDPVRKKLKTVILSEDKTGNVEEDSASSENKESDIYQHVVDSDKCDQHAMDAATEDQMKERPAKEDEEESKQDENAEMEMQMDEELIPIEDDDNKEINAEKNEKGDKKDSKKSNVSDKKDDNIETEVINIDGDVVETSTVMRGIESSFFTNLMAEDETLTSVPLEQKRMQMTNMMEKWSAVPTTEEACRAWNALNAMVDVSARELSEKLRLILEPTQASRLKGDYRTGKRINMRKIIPYIASQFRKDKIWLRRTKPSKRDYQIVIAIDDSSSMADNYSKELAFESLALISKALTYLEAGQLSVVSFGEIINVLHPLGEPFTERNGSYLMQELRFEQKRTMIAKMMNATVDMFEDQPSSFDNAKLLVILSDGRGVFSEGKEIITRAVRRAKLSDIFVVFVIVDNPKSKDSILDIKLPIIRPDGTVKCDSYMDSFPFPFYIILRDVSSLTDVLSDALRQWFEVVGTMNN